jgi:PhnB protein
MTITITPYLLYEDVDAALEFLRRAFGFEEVLRYTGAEGYVSHAEARIGDTSVYLGDPGGDFRDPSKLGAATVLVGVDGIADVDALCERAREAGAQIIEEPADQVYGARRFSARDPEGHEWFFSRQIAEVAPEDWGATTPAGA